MWKFILIDQSKNFALNITGQGYPQPSASVDSIPDSLFQAIDGRIWYFPEITNRWTTQSSKSKNDWYEIDFGNANEISVIKVYLVSDGKILDVPDSIPIGYHLKQQWMPVEIKDNPKLIGNTSNAILFKKFLPKRLGSISNMKLNKSLYQK